MDKGKLAKNTPPVDDRFKYRQRFYFVEATFQVTHNETQETRTETAANITQVLGDGLMAEYVIANQVETHAASQGKQNNETWIITGVRQKECTQREAEEGINSDVFNKPEVICE